MRLAVLGVGLIGGSVALAGRERLGAHVTGWDPVPDALAVARERGALDAACADVAAAVAGADAVLCAAPVGQLPALVGEALAVAAADTVVTDAGSVKRELAAAHPDPRFVPGHPLAGAETGGIAHARADLFDGATWYLCPGAAASGVLYERLHRLLRGIGARPVAIDAAVHDRMLAAVSHLPHVLANVLAAQAAGTLATCAERVPAAGPSLRDATRVAGAPSAIWTDIYLANRDALLSEVDGTIARLQEVRGALAAGDGAGLRAWNDAAAHARHALQSAGSDGEALHALRVAVPNAPGIVAAIALALGRAGVNIADLALDPAPDMSDGVITLWIAGAEEARRARGRLLELGHTVMSAP